MANGDYDRRRAAELEDRRELLAKIGAYVCDICSAVIVNVWRHKDWHYDND